MRDFKGMKRQRGRGRGGGGKPQQHNANRAFESNGPEGVKVRGNAQTVFEKYQQLARDAASAGDRVLAENYLQHAEHYFRTLRAMQPQRTAAEIIGRDYQSSGFDIDFEAEPEDQPEGGEGDNDGGEGEAQQGEQRQQGQQGERQYRDDRPRERFENRDRQQGERQQQQDRPRGDRFENRDRQQGDRPRDDRPRDDRPREDRPREDKPREDRPQGEGRRDRWRDRQDRFDRGERPRDETPRDPLAVVEPQAAPLPAAEPAGASPVLRSASGDVSHAPAFLAAPRAEAAATEDAPAKPRRPRKPKTETTEA